MESICAVSEEAVVTTSDSPAEIPTETPIETPTKTPVETPTETSVETSVETPVETPTESPVESQESCLPCFGIGKLLNYISDVPKHKCPWCNGVGRVHPEVNKVFLRVDRTLPNVGKFCVVFGAPDKKK